MLHLLISHLTRLKCGQMWLWVLQDDEVRLSLFRRLAKFVYFKVL
jgi:hypothetical protein